MPSDRPKNKPRKTARACYSSGAIVMATIGALHNQCLGWVIFVRSTRFRRSRHVRFAPIASEPSHRSDRRGVPKAAVSTCSKKRLQKPDLLDHPQKHTDARHPVSLLRVCNQRPGRRAELHEDRSIALP